MMLLRLPMTVLLEPNTVVSVFKLDELLTVFRLPKTVTFCSGLPGFVLVSVASSYSAPPMSLLLPVMLFSTPTSLFSEPKALLVPVNVAPKLLEANKLS